MVRIMNAVKLTILSVLGLFVSVSPALGDGPSTRPDLPVNLRAELRAVRNMFMSRNPNANPIHFTQDEWNEMMNFMESVSPARAAVLERTNPPEQSTVCQGLIRRWRAYKFVREHFPEMADLQARRFTLEDDLFVLSMDEKESESDVTSRPGDLDDLRDHIRAKITELLDLGIQEDRLRIETLQKALASMNAKLSADQANEPRIIDDRTDRIMGRFPWPTTRPAGASPRGGADRGNKATVADQADADMPQAAAGAN